MQRTTTTKTAILVFAQSANIEACDKRIANGKVLFEHLTERILAEVKKTNVPYFHFSEQQQTGETFGDRFANAIQSVFDRGFENIITMGNDSPQLKFRHIRSALEALAKGKNALGPSNDGGFYLMGLQKQSFEKATFKALPWQTRHLFKAMKNVLDKSDETVQLGFLIDIDTTKDIKELLRSVKVFSKKLYQLFLNTLERPKSLRIGGPSPLSKINYHTLPHLTRGSPRFAI